MRNIIIIFGLTFALGTAHAEKTSVMPCTRTSNGSVIFDDSDLQSRAREFAITQPRFFKVDQFRKTSGSNEDENSKGTCIIHFMSEEEFNARH